ncbi:hypothetical protein [Rhodococcus opacus]|uniref:hypothetical protein n=1 Tax=Rhodococcus opacus TaxID=37919 RepID=UPI001F57DBAE|nr:hypothetical protein [Rhodococcus opacus]UNN00746.1 hypothetical protein MOO23_34890 [Rhodococcus opacus]
MSEFTVAVLALIVAAIAVILSGAALRYAYRQTRAAEDSADEAKRSADAAERSSELAEVVEKGRHFGWRIERNDDTHFPFVLRNVGSLDARDVQLEGAYHPLAFKLGEIGPDGPVDIGSGQCRRFAAHTDIHRNWGGDLTISWTPAAGDLAGERQTWIEIPPAVPA